MEEIAVIGGGVAGLAAVRALQLAGCTPLLITSVGRQADNYGETLGPSAARTMATLQWQDLLDDPAIAVPVEAKFSVWGSSRLARQHPNSASGGFGWHVDRQRLEAEMLDRVGSMPVRRMTGGVRRVERLPDGWRITLPSGSVTARFIVDASGRAGIVARNHGAKRRLDRLVAAYATVPLPEAELHHASLVDAAPTGWWYTAAMPGGRLFMAHFSDADLLPNGLTRDAESWTVLLASAPAATRARLDSLWVAPAGPAQGIAAAGTVLPSSVSGPDWVAVGDAAAALDPLASHGLAVALWSGERAATAAMAALQGNTGPLDAYDAATASGMNQFIDGYLSHYGAERRFLDEPFWRRRHDALRTHVPPPRDPVDLEFGSR